MPTYTATTTVHRKNTFSTAWKRAITSCGKWIFKRLHTRHTDTEEVIAGRLAKASAELEWISRYDYVIVNDDLDAAINKAVAVISAEECKSWRNENLIASIKKMYEIK